MDIFRRAWPFFLAAAAAFALAGCVVATNPDGYTDTQAVGIGKTIAEAADSVVEPILGLGVEDVGGVIADASDEALEVAKDATSGNYGGLFSSVAALIAAVAASVLYRKNRKVKKNA